MASENVFNAGRSTDDVGRPIIGRGEYISLSFGPHDQYLLNRDSFRNKWIVSHCRVNLQQNIILIFVGEAQNLADAMHMAEEDAGANRDDRRIALDPHA